MGSGCVRSLFSDLKLDSLPSGVFSQTQVTFEKFSPRNAVWKFQDFSATQILREINF